MLQSVKRQVRDPEVAALLELAVFPDPEHVERAIRLYEEQEEVQLLAYVEEGETLGIIGYRPTGTGEITITHIAVEPESRGLGYGRGMMLELMVMEKPERVIAETDEEAVDFYRSIGFAVIGQGLSSSGLERFRCVYSVDEDEEE
ncbi:GNAT family N-acetyltransferase [Saccharibacillus alkalitolerans]|uniref:GNAT family N-acetyltransferase n=1 Tax=Saccharibacillus alkalitolerans TaxID=2705290 RepID=A0ABX0F8N3_9BACL|nr:GNAT family N-acetyltransferase [Saccharibacillus alkalitolerans]NGZ75566.1 GNAT family N-acetyltransferase [Saccharibacillus alkalitolerans]